jgi:hypothetical protein
MYEDDPATRKLRPMLAQRGIGEMASTDAASSAKGL